MVCRFCEWEGTAKRCPECKKACKYSGKLLHDMRRTTARRLLAAGVSTQVAKRLMGMESDSILERYGLAGEAELILAAQKKGAAFGKASSS
jgi:integrase